MSYPEKVLAKKFYGDDDDVFLEYFIPFDNGTGFADDEETHVIDIYIEDSPCPQSVDFDELILASLSGANVEVMEITIDWLEGTIEKIRKKIEEKKNVE